MQSDSCVACYYVRTCPQSARTTAWMKSRNASPKERPVCNVCMSWLLRDGLADEREPSHLRMPCSTRGPVAQQQVVQLMPACNPKGSATDGSHRPREAVVCPASVLAGQSCNVPLVGVESSVLHQRRAARCLLRVVLAMIALFLFSCSGCLGCGLILWIHLTVIVMMFSICGKIAYQFLMIQPVNARHANLLGVAFLPWLLPKPVRRG